MGGGLLQMVNRDTQKFAIKASATRIGKDGAWVPFKKDPVTDQGKMSKEGRFVLTRETGRWQTVSMLDGFDWSNHLEDVWINGLLLRDQTFDGIREFSNQKARD